MELTRKFRWLAAADAQATHLSLEPGGEYPCGNVSAEIIERWIAEGKAELIEDPVGVELAPSIMLKVQDGSIGIADLIGAVKAGVKEERHG